MGTGRQMFLEGSIYSQRDVCLLVVVLLSQLVNPPRHLLKHRQASGFWDGLI